MMEINGFSESQLINLLRLAIDLAGDGVLGRIQKKKTLKEYLDHLESRM